MLHVSSICTPCYLLLHVAESCCTKFETGQNFSCCKWCNNSQQHATTSNRLLAEDFRKRWYTTVGRQLADCRPTVGRLLANCWPTVGRLLTNSRLTVFWRSRSSLFPNSQQCWELLANNDESVCTVFFYNSGFFDNLIISNYCKQVNIRLKAI